MAWTYQTVLTHFTNFDVQLEMYFFQLLTGLIQQINKRRKPHCGKQSRGPNLDLFKFELYGTKLL